ncbi:DUF3427 domain-containing protein [Dyadobacter endophyticus]|uniref:DUF3427 domain-containing protein n=1 Tax=Dyadobacter endophyticus TaxID=1749036 RepID=UPI0034D9772D
MLLITLEKTEANYSPTTLYNDYAVSEKIFHWQSQNTARPKTGKGLSYIKQKQTGESILLFVCARKTMMNSIIQLPMSSWAWRIISSIME